MTRKEFVEFLANHDIPYKEYAEGGFDFVYVYPHKDHSEDQPYIRVSHFDGAYWLTKDRGRMQPENVMRRCLGLGA